MSAVEIVQIVGTVCTLLAVLFLAGSWKGRHDATGQALDARMGKVEGATVPDVEKRLSALEARAASQEHELDLHNLWLNLIAQKTDVRRPRT